MQERPERKPEGPLAITFDSLRRLVLQSLSGALHEPLRCAGSSRADSTSDPELDVDVL